MAERPGENPYCSDRARQLAITKRLVISIGVLGGIVFGLVLRRYFGWV